MLERGLVIHRLQVWRTSMNSEPGAITSIVSAKEITEAVERAEESRRNEALRKKVSVALERLVESSGVAKYIGPYAVAVGVLRDSEQIGMRLIPTEDNDLKGAVGEFFKGYVRTFIYDVCETKGYVTREFCFP